MEAEPRPRAPKPNLVRPLPPSLYNVPPGALRVTTSAQLVEALRGTRPTTIVLADGVYGGPAPLLNTHGHRLSARRWGEQS
jgi:hypothetical protein